MEINQEIKSNWLKQHADTLVILGAFAASLMWMNGKFNDIEKDITVIKTVLVLKNILPTELANVGE